MDRQWALEDCGDPQFIKFDVAVVTFLDLDAASLAAAKAQA